MLCERLRKLRKSKKLTQQELSDILNTNRSNIANYEQNISEPSIEMLIKMASFFGVTIDYLTGYSPYKNIDEEVKFKEINISGNAFSALHPNLQLDLTETINKYIEFIAAVDREKNLIVYNEIYDNLAMKLNKNNYFLVDHLLQYLNYLYCLNLTMKENYNNKSLSQEIRNANIKYTEEMNEIRRLHRNILKMFENSLDDLLYYFVLYFHYYGKDNRLI